MKKLVALSMAALAASACMMLSAGAEELIKVGIVNNPPSESGYREANVKDFEEVFNE